MATFKLVMAIWNHDIDEVKRILSDGKCSIDGDNEEKDPPLIECVKLHPKDKDKDEAGRCAILRLLVRYGADVNVHSRASHMATASIVAAWRGHLQCLKVLVESGADLNITSGLGYSPLMMAVMGGHVDCVQYLTQKTSAVVLNFKNNLGKTVLMIAASCEEDKGFLSMQHLLEAGVDINGEDGNGNTAIMLAIKSNSSKCVNLLLESGTSVNTVSTCGESPLSLCVSHGRSFSKFVFHGLDVTMSRSDRFCLHVAVRDGRFDLVRALVMNGFPPLDLKFNDIISFQSPPGPSWVVVYTTLYHLPPISPLTVAIVNKRPDIAEYLVTNRFFTYYDIYRASWDYKLRDSLHDKYGRWDDKTKSDARQCLQILDNQSRKFHSLRDLCLVTIRSALSQDFARDPTDNVQGRDRWMCTPTFRERVERLAIPLIVKKTLLFQTSSSLVCCHSRNDINPILRESLSCPECREDVCRRTKEELK